MAEEFDISREAAVRRFVELHPVDLAVVFCKDSVLCMLPVAGIFRAFHFLRARNTTSESPFKARSPASMTSCRMIGSMLSRLPANCELRPCGRSKATRSRYCLPTSPATTDRGSMTPLNGWSADKTDKNGSSRLSRKRRFLTRYLS